MNPSSLRIQQLEKSYGKRKVLRGLSFSVEPGQITAVAGPNASGKTTLLKCILGLVLPDRGQILVNGQAVAEGSDYRQFLGYVPQLPDFPPNLAVRELFQMLEGLRRQAAPRKQEYTEFFALESFLKQPFGQLSGGTKQKVAAVIALMFDAPVLVLDEPTASLDPLSTVHLKDALAGEAARGKTILLASHAMTELDELATELIYIVEGSIAFKGAIDQLKRVESEKSLERAILSRVRA